ncbi:hypothetical protein [Pseudomonas sp. Marseille-QA0892]
MIYTSTRAAVVSALAAEAIDNTNKQAWQKLYRPGYAESSDIATLMNSCSSEAIGRMYADCWVHARLHSMLKPRHWNALVAQFSTHKARKVKAIGDICPVIASHAPRLFVQKAVTAWAIPPLKGAEGKRSTDMIVLPARFYDMNGWDTEARPERTRRRWRQDVNSKLDGLVEEGLREAERILVAEGVLLDMAA